MIHGLERSLVGAYAEPPVCSKLPGSPHPFHLPSPRHAHLTPVDLQDPSTRYSVRIGIPRIAATAAHGSSDAKSHKEPSRPRRQAIWFSSLIVTLHPSASLLDHCGWSSTALVFISTSGPWTANFTNLLALCSQASRYPTAIMFPRAALTSLLLGTSSVLASSSGARFAKRDSWGPAFSLGPAKAGIVSTTTTIYPGKMPSDQTGLLYLWLGISNGTGDLVQSIIGSYPAGQSECSGSNADTAWCVSSEVYGTDASTGYPNQWVGDLRTADVNYENGINLTYTLVDESSYLWLQ
jgi:hypothetical protein